MDTDQSQAPPKTAQRSRRGLWIVPGLIALGVIVLVLVLRPSSSAEAETSDMSLQGGEGVWAVNGVELVRSQDALQVSLKIPRPMPGEYTYPPAETPAGDPTPPVGVGESEVFTLWMFVFNHPELCRDPYTCRLVDIFGDDEMPDPPAAGGVYQLSAIIATGNILEMDGEVMVGTDPATGAPLTNTKCSHVHIGMAPHGEALDGEDLEIQMSTTIGGPAFFWAASFEFLDSSEGC